MIQKLCFLILLSSCSVFTNVEDNRLNLKVSASSKKVQRLFCKSDTSKTQILSENELNNRTFSSFIKSTQKKYQLQFVDYVVLWSLVQMNIRPDLSAKSARIQYVIKLDNSTYYQNTFSTAGTDSTPYLVSLNTLLKKHNSRYSLKALAKILDQQYPSSIYVTQSFQTFLKEKISQIKSQNSIARRFMRADETLRKNERLKKINFSKVVSTIKSKSIKNTDKLITYKNKDLIFKCNYDMNLYSKQIYLLSPIANKSNVFGLKLSNNFFIASSTQVTKSQLSFNQTFSGVSDTRPATLCLHQSEKDLSVFLSSDSRDPAQHIFHAIDQDKSLNISLDDILRLNMSGRYLFLQNPDRVIIESHRFSKKQINAVLQHSTPVYHTQKLGKITSYIEDKNEVSFVIDDRSEDNLKCVDN